MTTPTSTAACTPCRSARPEPTRAARETRAALPQRRRAPSEIVFVRGTTEAINLVARAWGRGNVEPGDEILITGLEHHSNIVPWQMLCEETRRAPARRADRRPRRAPPRRVRAAALPAHPARRRRARLERARHGQPGARDRRAGPRARRRRCWSTARRRCRICTVDVQALDCDFYAFSGHKVYGPTGIGVLCGRAELLDAMPPWQGGGDMIQLGHASRRRPTRRPRTGSRRARRTSPARSASRAALDYLDRARARRRSPPTSTSCSRLATERLAEIPGLRIVGTARAKAAVLSFTMEGIHPHDVGTILDHEGIAVRAGHHCAQPVMERFGVPATARASFALYNTARGGRGPGGRAFTGCGRCSR